MPPLLGTYILTESWRSVNHLAGGAGESVSTAHNPGLRCATRRSSRGDGESGNRGCGRRGLMAPPSAVYRDDRA